MPIWFPSSTRGAPELPESFLEEKLLMNGKKEMKEF
jgi:hypothetical protein